MAEAAAPGAGQALRVYQLLFVLAVGFLAGRVPALFEAGRSETAELARALDPVAAPPAGRPPPAAEENAAASDLAARIAAEVAARVAADVADATIARLLAAGWGPPETRAERPTPAAGPVRAIAPSPPAETVVRVVAEVRPPDAATLSALGWRLTPPASPPGGGGAAPAGPADARLLPETRAGPPPRAHAHATAALGYEQLRRGERRAAAESLARALALDPEAEQAAAWAADLRQLRRRWRVSTYSLSREGTGDPLAASPVLGGGQAGASLAFALDPLARRPVSAVARVTSAAGPDGALDPETAEAALGLRWQPLAGVPLALDLERRFALGTLARNAWAARISGGASGRLGVGPRPLLWDGWGEAGIVGEREADVYAGGQVRAAVPVFALGRVSLDAGAGLWAAAQRTGETAVGRLDLGPSARLAFPPFPFQAQVDWRVRALGRAEPGTGLALTVSGNF